METILYNQLRVFFSLFLESLGSAQWDCVAGNLAGSYSRTANLSLGGEWSWPYESFRWVAAVSGFLSPRWQLVLAIWHRSVSDVVLG